MNRTWISKEEGEIHMDDRQIGKIPIRKCPQHFHDPATQETITEDNESVTEIDGRQLEQWVKFLIGLAIFLALLLGVVKCFF